MIIRPRLRIPAVEPLPIGDEIYYIDVGVVKCSLQRLLNEQHVWQALSVLFLITGLL